VRVVGEAQLVRGVEERKGLAPPRDVPVGAQAFVDDAALVSQPVLHLPQRLRRRRHRWPPPTRAARLRDGAVCLLRLLPRGRRRRLRGLPVAAGAVLGGGLGETSVARGAEGRGALGVEGSPAHLVRQARVRLQCNTMHGRLTRC
jgi:hypothetical protein